jgi:hypothetical protein
MSFLPKDERLFVIDRYIDFCRLHISHFVTETADYEVRTREMPHKPAVVADTLEALDHSQKQWELELEWGLRLWNRERNSQ